MAACELLVTKNRQDPGLRGYFNLHIIFKGGLLGVGVFFRKS